MKTVRTTPRLQSPYAITRFDRIMLGYGALCGFLLVLYLSGNPLLALLLGVPPGIFGSGVPMLVHKRFSSVSDVAGLQVESLRRVGPSVAITLILLLGFRAWVGDWFGFACTIMMAGAILLAFTNVLGYFGSVAATHREP